MSRWGSAGAFGLNPVPTAPAMPEPALPEPAILERIGAPLGDEQLRTLASYVALVARWNVVAGLVSGADLNRFAHRHLVDSLLLAPLIRERASQSFRPACGAPPIADFGSGAGLPGVPLAIALPSIAFRLVDRSEKKTRFLRRVRDELDLPNLSVFHGDLGELPRRSLGAVVARAAMPVSKLWPHARAALASGGYLLAADRIVHSRYAPDDEPPSGCEGAAVRRHWLHIPEFDAWHGVLEMEEANAWPG